MSDGIRGTKFVRRLGLYALAGMIACLSGLFASSAAYGQKIRANAHQFNSTPEVLIHYKEGKSADAERQARASGFEVLENYRPGKYLRCVPGPGVADVSITVNAVAESEAVGLVEPNFIVSIPSPPNVGAARPQVARASKAGPVVPNDAEWSKLWGMVNVHAPQAWSSNHDSPVIVAVIDTGVDYDHPDLHANMWRNPGEIPGNGKDDDGNGVVDDVYGAKFENGVGTGDPRDDNRHGTHCSGTIGAVGNNMIGVAGVNWKVQIMALKFLRANGSGATNDAVRCIDYAIDKKAKVLSCSWGGGGFSQALEDAITRAEAAGMLLVAAAGNNGQRDNDASPNYPSNYPNANIIAVAAIDPSDDLSSFSHFGKTTVHLAAPGGAGTFPPGEDDIYSTLPGNQYGFLAGTSMATPHVSGAAALVLGHPAYKNASPAGIKKLLMDHVRALPALKNKCVTEGTLDIQFLGK